MIPHLVSYCDIETNGHELMNAKWVIDLYYDV